MKTKMYFKSVKVPMESKRGEGGKIAGSIGQQENLIFLVMWMSEVTNQYRL